MNVTLFAQKLDMRFSSKSSYNEKVRVDANFSYVKSTLASTQELNVKLKKEIYESHKSYSEIIKLARKSIIKKKYCERSKS